jgi:hypothetical protein
LGVAVTAPVVGHPGHEYEVGLGRELGLAPREPWAEVPVLVDVVFWQVGKYGAKAVKAIA